jgi:hypothetical protein
LRRAICACSAVILLSMAIALTLPSSTSEHIRHSCNGNPSGFCPYYWGDTRDTNDTHSIDPINIIWWPYGHWGGTYFTDRVGYYLRTELGWTHTCGGTQGNHRAYVSGVVVWALQDGSEASSGCPLTRYHSRVFRGHIHGSCCLADDWSLGDAHHETFPFHHIDRDWDLVENQTASFGWEPYAHYYQYLPRGAGTFSGYFSDGWATHIMVLHCGGFGCS